MKPQPMRVVVSSGSRTWGGLEKMAELLALGLASRGHEVAVFCRRDSPLHERLRERLPCAPILGGGHLHPLTIARCLRELRRRRTQVVIGNTFKDPSWTGVAARILGLGVVYRHEFNLPYPSGARDRYLFQHVPHRHVVISRTARNTLLSGSPWVPPDRITVIHNGVDLAEHEAAPVAELGLPQDAIVFGYVGRMEAEKGIRELVAAWRVVEAELASAHLVVSGWGPLEEEAREAIGGSPRVHWLPQRQHVPSLMKALDVLLFPSWREGFGLVAVEAMAVGTPVIACDTSSLPELMSDGVEGLLVPVADGEALARAMLRLAADPEERARMGAAGQRRARSFSLERMIERHEELLAELVAGRAG